MPPEEQASLADIERAPTGLPAPEAPIDAQSVANLLKKVQILSEENEKLENDLRQAKRDKRTTEMLDSLIQPFAIATFIFMVVYCWFVGCLLLDQETNRVFRPISDEVMKVLVGSTAVTVIGLVGMILTGIFVGARPKQ